jgi:hypothetical protein
MKVYKFNFKSKMVEIMTPESILTKIINGSVKAELDGNVKYLGDVKNNYEPTYFERTRALIFDDDFNVDVDKATNVFINMIIFSKQLKLDSFLKVETDKIEYFKSLLR